MNDVPARRALSAIVPTPIDRRDDRLDQPDRQPRTRRGDEVLRDDAGGDRRHADADAAPPRDRRERAGALHRVADEAEVLGACSWSALGHGRMIA